MRLYSKKTSPNFMILFIVIAFLFPSCSKHKKDNTVYSTVIIKVYPYAALSSKAMDEDLNVIIKRLNGLKLKKIKVIKRNKNHITLSFSVNPNTIKTKYLLQDISWLLSHTGKWSVHPIIPIKNNQKLPKEVYSSSLNGIKTLSSSLKVKLKKFIDTLGDPYPNVWVLLREGKFRGDSMWHAFLAGPKIKYIIKNKKIITPNFYKPITIMVDDEPWIIGKNGTILLNNQKKFLVLITTPKLHLPWRVENLSSFTKLH